MSRVIGIAIRPWLSVVSGHCLEGAAKSCVTSTAWSSMVIKWTRDLQTGIAQSQNVPIDTSMAKRNAAWFLSLYSSSCSFQLASGVLAMTTQPTPKSRHRTRRALLFRRRYTIKNKWKTNQKELNHLCGLVILLMTLMQLALQIDLYGAESNQFEKHNKGTIV